MSHVKYQLLDLIKTITFHRDLLSKRVFLELSIIQNRLIMYNEMFSKEKVFTVSDLSYDLIPLQDILVHNKHLQSYIKEEYNEYKRPIGKLKKSYWQRSE